MYLWGRGVIDMGQKIKTGFMDGPLESPLVEKKSLNFC